MKKLFLLSLLYFYLSHSLYSMDKISVETALKGKIGSFDIDINTTISDIKKKLEASEGIPSDRQELYAICDNEYNIMGFRRKWGTFPSHELLDCYNIKQAIIGQFDTHRLALVIKCKKEPTQKYGHA